MRSIGPLPAPFRHIGRHARWAIDVAALPTNAKTAMTAQLLLNVNF